MMTDADFDTYLRGMAALRPTSRHPFGRLNPVQRREAREALKGLEMPATLSAVQRWTLARVRAYVLDDEPRSGRWVPPDPSDAMEQMLTTMARANERLRKAAIKHNLPLG